MVDESPLSAHRLERVLAYMIAAIVALSIICFIVIIIATASGMQQQDFLEGAWLLVSYVPFLGLPLAMVLIVALLIISARRRSRDAKDAGR